METQGLTESKNFKHQNLFLLVILALTAAIRALPMLKAPLSTFGYDYGFYLYDVKRAAGLNFHNLLLNRWGNYGNVFFSIAAALRLPAELTLTVSFFVLTIAAAWAFYLFFKKQNVLAGLAAAALFALSIPQNEAYLMFLWKNAAGLLLLILAFKFIAEKKLWGALICSLGILVFHRTTAVIYALTLFFYFLFWQAERRQWRLLMAEIIAGIIAGIGLLPVLQKLSSGFLNNPNESVVNGIFLYGQDFLKIELLTLALALPGIYFYLRRRQHPLLLIFLLTTVGWIVFRLPFYNRILLYVDAALIFFAAYFISQCWSKDKFKIILLIIILALALDNVLDYLHHKFPAISPAQVAEISSFTQTHSGGFILAPTADYAPWLLGYANQTRLAAPGLFEDRHSLPEWQKFWAGKNQVEFLKAYPQPLYLYQYGDFLASPAALCLRQETEHFYKFDCN